MLNSIVINIFFCFRPEVTFSDKFGLKFQNYLIKLQFGKQANSNKRRLVAVFTFSFLDWKYLFWANLVQKLKIIWSRENLVPGLIRIYGFLICLFILFLAENALFDKIGLNYQSCYEFLFKITHPLEYNLSCFHFLSVNVSLC